MGLSKNQLDALDAGGPLPMPKGGVNEDGQGMARRESIQLKRKLNRTRRAVLVMEKLLEAVDVGDAAEATMLVQEVLDQVHVLRSELSS